MNFPSRLSSHTWIIALICAGGFLLWINVARVQRVDYISGLAEPPVASEAASPTGYASGLRRLIVPGHDNESYQWIAQTQQMLARGEARVRHVDYDNAPLGREVRSPSPYRWWLGLVAWCDQLLSGRPMGQAVERAAVWADPVLHALFLIGTVIFTARQFGNFPATLLAFGLAVAFPLAGSFLAGQPNDSSLAQICGFWSVLLLLTGISPVRKTEQAIDGQAGTKRSQKWFFVAGVAGGIGLWVNVPRELSIILGIALGGLFVTWLKRNNPTATQIAPWRIWSFAGATTTLCAYFIEYFPSHMEALRVDTIHPLLGIAWLGLGELLERASAWRQKKTSFWTVRQTTGVVLAILAVAAVPVIVKFSNGRFMADDAFASRLTNLSDSATAPNLWAWLVRDGFTAMAIATFLPVLILGPAVWSLARRATAADQRERIALTLGPVLLVLGFASFQLGWWSLADSTLLALLIAITTTVGSTPKLSRRLLWSTGLAVILIPGAVFLLRQTLSEKKETVVESDVIALIERDLAYWLANQAGSRDAIVLAPPNLTTSLYFHGGLGGLGTPYWENKDGFAAAVRIAGATSPEEAQAAAQNRNLTYIVIPSWDSFMDEYARLGSREPDRSLVALLRQWLPPRWLRPVPYHLPKISGFEGLSLVIFQVTDVQDNPAALSRLAEYFIEMEQIDQAVLVSQALERLFPDDLGALVARSLVAQAAGNATAATNAMNELPAYVVRGDDSALPWDRRVSLAIALAEGKRFELAKDETKRCLAELDESGVRLLTTVSLYRLQVLTKSFGLEIADPRLRVLARGLLPAELSEKL
jgi:hypothetical protein